MGRRSLLLAFHAPHSRCRPLPRMSSQGSAGGASAFVNQDLTILRSGAVKENPSGTDSSKTGSAFVFNSSVVFQEQL